jgi:hypothetical protein
LKLRDCYAIFVPFFSYNNSVLCKEIERGFIMSLYDGFLFLVVFCCLKTTKCLDVLLFKKPANVFAHWL